MQGAGSQANPHATHCRRHADHIFLSYPLQSAHTGMDRYQLIGRQPRLAQCLIQHLRACRPENSRPLSQRQEQTPIPLIADKLIENQPEIQAIELIQTALPTRHAQQPGGRIQKSLRRAVNAGQMAENTARIKICHRAETRHQPDIGMLATGGRRQQFIQLLLATIATDGKGLHLSTLDHGRILTC